MHALLLQTVEDHLLVDAVRLEAHRGRPLLHEALKHQGRHINAVLIDPVFDDPARHGIDHRQVFHHIDRRIGIGQRLGMTGHAAQHAVHEALQVIEALALRQHHRLIHGGAGGNPAHEADLIHGASHDITDHRLHTAHGHRRKLIDNIVDLDLALHRALADTGNKRTVAFGQILMRFQSPMKGNIQKASVFADIGQDIQYDITGIDSCHLSLLTVVPQSLPPATFIQNGCGESHSP